ncbi:hypothetical protein ACQP2X_28045 [Actinoplanes sp. CA-131856]
MSVPVNVPSPFVSSGWGTPTVCSRHGQPAVEHKRTRFISRVPSWGYVLLLAGAIPFVIFALVTRKTVEAPAWPFCARCGQTRTRGLIAGIALVAAGVAGLFAGSSLSGDAGAPVWILSLVLVMVGYIVALRGGNRMLLAGGHVTERGQFVTFPKAHEAFAAQAAAALSSAEQSTRG